MSYPEDNFDEYQDEFLKHIYKRFEELRRAMEEGKMQGEWKFEPIEEPGKRGYVAYGRFGSQWPEKPIEPFQPKIPKNPRGIPREPYSETMEDEANFKVYIELPGVEKENIKLEFSQEALKVKAGPFNKKIDLPSYLDTDNASTQYNNGVIEILIPKIKSKEREAKKTGKMEGKAKKTGEITWLDS